MYTHIDLIRDVKELKEMINQTEITEMEFNRIEKKLNQLFDDSIDEISQQVSILVSEANNLCYLHREIQNSVNGLYSELKRKKLINNGVEVNIMYDGYISSKLKYADFLNVELKRTGARI